jgi:DNA-binding MarR family transcriptional regulator
MSHVASAWALLQNPRSANHKMVLVVLADYAHPDDGTCFPSQTTIAKRALLSERTVRQVLADLEADGFIKRERRSRPDGTRTSDLIALGPIGLPAQFAGRAESTGNADCRLSEGDNRQTEEPLPLGKRGLPANHDDNHRQAEPEPTGKSRQSLPAQFAGQKQASTYNQLDSKTPPSTPLSPPSSEKESTRAARAESSARKAGIRRLIPDDFALTPKLEERLRATGYAGDIHRTFDAMVMHFREGNGIGQKHVNWEVTAVKWFTNQIRIDAERQARNQARPQANGSSYRPNGHGSKPLKTPELEARVIAEWTTKVADLGWAHPPSPRMAGYSYKVREEQPKEIQDQWMKAHQLLMRMESEAYREPGV